MQLDPSMWMPLLEKIGKKSDLAKSRSDAHKNR